VVTIIIPHSNFRLFKGIQVACQALFIFLLDIFAGPLYSGHDEAQSNNRCGTIMHQLVVAHR
jgi:hypothetical protein